MTDLKSVTITADDVERFRKGLEREKGTLSPEASRKRLIKFGILTKDGKPTWPTDDTSKKVASGS